MGNGGRGSQTHRRRDAQREKEKEKEAERERESLGDFCSSWCSTGPRQRPLGGRDGQEEKDAKKEKTLKMTQGLGDQGHSCRNRCGIHIR